MKLYLGAFLLFALAVLAAQWLGARQAGLPFTLDYILCRMEHRQGGRFVPTVGISPPTAEVLGACMVRKGEGR